MAWGDSVGVGSLFDLSVTFSAGSVDGMCSKSYIGGTRELLMVSDCTPKSGDAGGLPGPLLSPWDWLVAC